MEGQENPHPPEVKQEATFPVKPGPELFSYIVEHLRQVPQSATSAQEGSSKTDEALRLKRIMEEITSQYEGPDKLPENPTLSLSAEDISYIKEVLQPGPGAYAIERADYSGRMDLLKREFEKAQRESGTADSGSNEGFFGKLKSRFRK